MSRSQPKHGDVTPPYDPVRYPAPPSWPRKDDREPGCQHGYDGKWGVKGERQHFCGVCQRWCWDHLWPSVGETP